MAESKTKATDIPVSDFISGLPEAQVRQDCWSIVEIMQTAAQAEARMWGPAIVGFGQYRAVNSSGKSNDWMVIGFSPRKQAITLYLRLGGLQESEELLARLGKYTRGKGCLYIKHRADVNPAVLRQLVQGSVDYVHKTYSAGES